ncbi:MAG TPA: O-antigen ligase family protein [Pseudorhodoplanes sp.]|nr:O-antigen ligase family protein [Pseudorhodoplanes sp.]
MILALTPSSAQREKLMRLADYLVIGIAVALPWSTSATVIGICLWALVVIPTIEPKELWDEMKRPAALLPVALFALAALGMLWADVPFKERIKGIDSFLKLLTIPLLMIQFRRSDRAIWALAGFLASGTLLLAASGLILLSPRGAGWGLAKGYGLPVKDYIAQSAVFTICAFGLFYLAIDAFRLRWKSFSVLFLAIGVLFLADMFFVITSRTALLTLPFLLLLLGFRQFGWKGTAAACVIAVIAAAAVWASSHNVRDRVGNLAMEIKRQQTENIETPAGARIDFWKRSFASICEAPILGHGTGSIRETFKKSAVGEGASAVVPVNPHNQTFAVAIQLGIVGGLLLFAMWFSHLALFFGGAGMASWIGILLVAQNVIGSLANSHLFDFTHGWMYCIGVGVCGGIATRQGAPLSIFTPSCKAATAKP